MSDTPIGSGTPQQDALTGTAIQSTDRQERLAFFTPLLDVVNEATSAAKAKINQIRDSGSAISIADMFDMQMLMNRLGQLSEMSTGVVSAANTSIMSMARNVKG